MKELTTFSVVILAIFIWSAAVFHADAQGYGVDDWYAQQRQQDNMRDALQQQQIQQDLSNQAQRSIQSYTAPDGNYCYNCNGR